MRHAVIIGQVPIVSHIMQVAFSDPDTIAKLMDDFPYRWGICGGWAIDVFLGTVTRSHKDVDVAVLRQDQRALQTYLTDRGWILRQAINGALLPWATGQFLELPVHTIWCDNPAYNPSFVEILLNEASPTHFLFRRDPSITRELDQAFIRSARGLPILAPEIALLYKANAATQANNLADARHVLPAFDCERRTWLRSALVQIDPGHPWLPELQHAAGPYTGVNTDP